MYPSVISALGLKIDAEADEAKWQKEDAIEVAGTEEQGKAKEDEEEHVQRDEL